jgi:hypothetical protein
MPSPGIAVRRVVFCAIAASGFLSACGQSPKMRRDPGDGGSSSVAGGGAAGDTVAGGRSGTMGGAPSGEGGAGGSAGNTGGALTAAAGAAQGGTGGGGAGASVGGATGGSGGQSGGAAPRVVAPSYFHAGTRLKPRVLRVDGLEVLDSTTENPWYDTGTGSWCVFRKGDDGIERCFPDTGFNDNSDYLDSSCRKPAFIRSNLRCDGTAFQYISIGPYSGSACGSTSYRLGAPIPAGTPLYSNAADHCVSAGLSINTVWPLEKVPLDTFVAVQRVRRAALPNMDAWVREGADGSWEVIGFYDPVRKAPCSGLGPEVSSDACVPTWVEPSYTFADSACSRRVAIDNPVLCGASGATALLELDSTGDECSTTTTIKGLWQVTSGRGAQLFDYDPFNLSCTRSSLGTVTTYVQGAPIDIASLPKLQVIQVGTGSLEVSFYGFGNVPFVPVGGAASFTEVASGDACAPRPFADGTWRCVPTTFPRVADYDLFYQSSDCTGERLYPWKASVCPNAPRQPLGMIVQRFGCGPVPVSETLEFDGTSSSTSPVFHPTPSVACQDAGFSFAGGLKLFRATKVVNPAERFIPFERKLAD